MRTNNVNLSIPHSKGTYCLFPIPQSNHYQTISDIGYNPKPSEILTDRWKNEVGVFTLNDVKNIEMSFFHEAVKTKSNIDPSWKASDYKSKSIDPVFFETTLFVGPKDTYIDRISTELIGNKESVLDYIKILYDYVIEHLVYGNPTEGLYTYDQALHETMTDCGGFSTLLMSLLRNRGIPCRLVVGYLLKNNIAKRFTDLFHASHFTFHDLTMHAWVEVLLPDMTYFPLDPSVEWRRLHKKSHRKGGFGVVDNDRLVLSYGEEFIYSIDKKTFKIDLLQHPYFI